MRVLHIGCAFSIAKIVEGEIQKQEGKEEMEEGKK